MPRRRVIVDGYNVIKQDPDLSRLERLGLETARQALLAKLRSHPFLRGDEIVVVFDGAGKRATVENTGNVRVVFSEAGESADEMILRLADAAPADVPVLVLSDDLEVRREVVKRGGTAKSVRRRSRQQPTYDDRWHKEADGEELSVDKAEKKKTSHRRPQGRKPREPEVDSEFPL